MLDCIPSKRQPACNRPATGWRLGRFVLLTVLFAGAFGIAGQPHSAGQTLAPSDPKPNVIVFLADDAGWGDFSHNGNPQVQTPHIDSIARRGVVLDRFYVCPVCSPTRAEFLTGRYHPRGGVTGVSTGHERLDLSETTVADAFAAAGYATGAFGKWHNGSQYPYHPRGRGFGDYFGHTAGHWGEYFDAPLEDNGRMIKTNGYIVDVCTDRAISFIESNQNQPFFCYVPFTTPHSPWAAPPEDWERFKDRPIIKQGNANNEDLNQTRCALAMVENQDRNVGRVLSKLSELDILENTIIVYFSDNGPNTNRWNGDMKGRKGSTDEGGVRSVCFIQWPAGIPTPRTVPSIAGAIDLFPTLVGLAGLDASPQPNFDGKDLTPLLRGQASDWPSRMIFSSWAGRVSARSQTFRLDHAGNLYDMVTDPNQTRPANDRFPEVRQEMIAAVQAWRQDVGLVSAKPNGAGAKSDVDPRPFTVGYPEFPATFLPARDGNPIGEVRRSTAAPNCSYFVNWCDRQDRIEWFIDVKTPGQYEVTVDYTCPEGDQGSVIEIRSGQQRMVGRVDASWDPPLNTDQDTLPRPPIESQMKEFRTLRLGTMQLDAGVQTLQLRAVEIPGRCVMDLRRLTLTWVP